MPERFRVRFPGQHNGVVSRAASDADHLGMRRLAEDRHAFARFRRAFHDPVDPLHKRAGRVDHADALLRGSAKHLRRRAVRPDHERIARLQRIDGFDRIDAPRFQRPHNALVVDDLSEREDARIRFRRLVYHFDRPRNAEAESAVFCEQYPHQSASAIVFSVIMESVIAAFTASTGFFPGQSALTSLG